MNAVKKPVALLCIVAAIAAESIAHADGVCAAGFRNLTARDRAVMLETLEAAMKLKQPRLDAVTAKIQELSKKQIALMEKNDIEHATALSEDMAKLQEEYQKILDEGGGQQQLEAAAARASKDLQMNISITVNDGGQMFGPEVSNLALPPGADAAVRWESTSRGIDSSTAVILFGEWRNVAPHDWRIVPNPAVFTNKAHAIAIHVTADPERIAPTIAAIDFAGLAALLPK